MERTDDELWAIYMRGHQKDSVRYREARRAVYTQGMVDVLTWILETGYLSPATADLLVNKRDELRGR